MAGFNGISGYSSSLFSLGNNGAMSSMYSNLSQYASVRSGAYTKATKAYYAKLAKEDTAASKTDTKKNNTTNKTSALNTQVSALRNEKAAAALTTTKKEASELVDSAKKLTATGKDSLFNDKKGYDKDAVYKAVSNFVSEYNDTVKALGSTTNTSVRNAGDSMTRMTKAMSNSLSKIGVTVGDDGKLSVNEDIFKNADQKDVKALFNGTGSYAGIVSSSASQVATQATNQMSVYSGTQYGNNGAYYNGFVSGAAFNGFF